MARRLTYAQAISESIVQGMKNDPQVFLFGLGVDDYKGIFGTTRQAFEMFGSARVFDTPASENALTGVAIGAALMGKRPILVHARNDFMFLALDQMINNASKWKYTYAGRSVVPIVVRGIIGKGWGQGPTHSQSLQSVLAHFPGLIVAMPSTARDVKGIMLKALQSTSPVVILEHRSLYDLSDDVPESFYTVNFGEAKCRRLGKDITIVATSWMIEESLRAAAFLQTKDIEVEVIDPVTIQPLDRRAIIKSVEKTGRLLVADTSWSHCGFSAEVLALIGESGVPLKSPMRRITWPACPAPVSKPLEDLFYPNSQNIIQAVLSLLKKQVSTEDHMLMEDKFLGPY